MSTVYKDIERLVFNEYKRAEPMVGAPGDDHPLFTEILNLCTTDDFKSTVEKAKEKLHGDKLRSYMALANLFLEPFVKENKLPSKVEYVRASRHAHRKNAIDSIRVILQWILFARISQDIKKKTSPPLNRWKNKTAKFLASEAGKYGMHISLPKNKPIALPILLLAASLHFLAQSYFIYRKLTKANAPFLIMNCSIAIITLIGSYKVRKNSFDDAIEKVNTFSPKIMMLINIIGPTFILPGICSFIMTYYTNNMKFNNLLSPSSLLITFSLTAIYAAHCIFSKENEDENAAEADAQQTPAM